MTLSRVSSQHDSSPTYHVRAAHAVPYHELGGLKMQFTNNTLALDVPRAQFTKRAAIIRKGLVHLLSQVLGA